MSAVWTHPVNRPFASTLHADFQVQRDRQNSRLGVCASGGGHDELRSGNTNFGTDGGFRYAAGGEEGAMEQSSLQAGKEAIEAEMLERARAASLQDEGRRRSAKVARHASTGHVELDNAGRVVRIIGP